MKCIVILVNILMFKYTVNVYVNTSQIKFFFVQLYFSNGSNVPRK